MGSCTRRHFMLSTCFLQMITIIERQIFDFLGYMWAPIIVNFFQIIFVIFGFYGAYHLRVKYIITYFLWSFLCIGWNTFLICFYLNVGVLDRDSDFLNLGTGSVSWFEVNGYRCVPIYPTNITSEDPYRPLRPEHVDNCLVDYTVVEVIHSGVQCILAFVGIIGAIFISYIFIDEDDRLKNVNKILKHRQSLYSIEFGPSVESLRSRTDTILDYDNHLIEREVGELSPKPMTPRRVKRRSVMARGTNSRHSSTSKRSHVAGRSNNTDLSAGGFNGTNSSSITRNSRRKHHQNPVSNLFNQNQTLTHPQLQTIKQNFGSFHRNKDNYGLTESNLQTLNNEIIKRNISEQYTTGKTNNNICNNNYQGYRNNIVPDPIYHNTNAQNGLYQENWQPHEVPTSSTMLLPPIGHSNPTYQHSTSNLPDPEYLDEVYNNRPPSVRSSYSNFHGTRPLSSYLPNVNNNNNTTENVFIGLHGASQQQEQMKAESEKQYQLQHVPPSTPPLYQQRPLQQPIPPAPPPISLSVNQQCLDLYQPPDLNYSNSAVTPNLHINKQRTTSRESNQSMAFLNNGPPAYNLNYHTPPDSETTM